MSDQHVPQESEAKSPRTLKRDWLDELDGRRQEAINVALRNFMISRQFITDGSLTEAERLVRFYEGVLMSLERNARPEAFSAAKSAFKDVLRYELKPTIAGSTRESPQHTDWPRRSLCAQAEYNLAVLFHRRAVQLRETREGKQKEQLRAQPASRSNVLQKSRPGKSDAQVGEAPETALTGRDPQTNPETQSPFSDTRKSTAELKDPSAQSAASAMGALEYEEATQELLSEAAVEAQIAIDNLGLPHPFSLPEIREPKDPSAWPAAIAMDEYEEARQESLSEAAARYRGVLDAIENWGLGYQQFPHPEIWQHTILATGVAATVGSLLLRVEKHNAKEGLVPSLSDKEREELQEMSKLARNALRACADRPSNADNKTKSDESVPAAPQGGNRGAFDEFLRKLFGKLRTDKPIKSKSSSHAPSKDRGTEMLQEEMLEQLRRAGDRLGLSKETEASKMAGHDTTDPKVM